MCNTSIFVGALQVDQRATATPSDDWCYISGKYDDQTTLGLIDANDPTKGIQMTYYGDICSSTHTNRQFIIQLSCQVEFFFVFFNNFPTDVGLVFASTG